MKKPIGGVLAATAALSLAIVGLTFASGSDDGPAPGSAACQQAHENGQCQHASRGCNPENCKGKCNPENCKGKCNPENCKGKCNPEDCEGCCGGCGGHGKGPGMRGCTHHQMMAGVDYGTMTEECRAMLLKRHPKADTDGDGVLSESEFDAFKAQRMESRRAMILKHHPKADTDGDGVLSDGEFEAFRAQRMEARRALMLKCHPEADTDGDGSLSEEEARRFMRSRHGGGCHGRKPGNGS